MRFFLVSVGDSWKPARKERERKGEERKGEQGRKIEERTSKDVQEEQGERIKAASWRSEKRLRKAKKRLTYRSNGGCAYKAERDDHANSTHFDPSPMPSFALVLLHLARARH